MNMQLPDSLLTVFSAKIEDRDGDFVVELPEREVSLGDLREGDTYRIAILPPAADGDGQRIERTPASEPPVEEDETLLVEIEDVGEQGDGIARVGPGYIVFVPGTAIGEEVRIEITDVRENFAFGEVVDDDTDLL